MMMVKAMAIGQKIFENSELIRPCTVKDRAVGSIRVDKAKAAKGSANNVATETRVMIFLFIDNY